MGLVQQGKDIVVVQHSRMLEWEGWQNRASSLTGLKLETGTKERPEAQWSEGVIIYREKTEHP